MDEKDAINCLTTAECKKPSEIGEAVDVLYQIHGTYKEISQQLQLNLSDSALSSRHRIFQLPKGIRRKVDEGQIGISQAYQVTRLENEEDQWRLAIIAVEKNLRANECENVVNIVLKQNWTIKDAFRTVTGVRFEELSPPVLLLPIGVDFWFALSKSAWGQGLDWQDLCYQIIRQGIDVDVKSVATQLEALATSLREAGEEKEVSTINNFSEPHV